jgi:hypothetical protein
VKPRTSVGVFASLWIALSLGVIGPASAHNGGSAGTQQGDGTYTWNAFTDLSSPTPSQSFIGPLTVTVSSNSNHKVIADGPNNASISVSYDLWVENDASQVGSKLTATNLGVNLDGNGHWQQPSTRSGNASVDYGDHTAAAISDVVVGSAPNYAASYHSHDYMVVDG